MNNIELRPVEPADSRFLLDLANDPEIAARSSYSIPIPQDEHEAWFQKKISDPHCRIMIATINNAPIGQIRTDVVDGETVISIGLTKENRKKGYGVSVLVKRCQMAPGLYAAHVLKDNGPSLRAFEKAGFKRINDAEPKRVKMIFDNRCDGL